VIGGCVDVAAAHDGGDVPAGEAAAVFQDSRDAERGRRFDDQAGVMQEHPHPAMINASETRTASSATRRRSSRTAGMGYRPTTPSAMVSVGPVVTTRR
jgi:hypothetical protein